MNEPENATDPASLSEESTTEPSAAAKTSDPNANNISSLYAPVQDLLNESERQHNQELSSKESKLQEIFSQSRHLAGKRMRPHAPGTRKPRKGRAAPGAPGT